MSQDIFASLLADRLDPPTGPQVHDPADAAALVDPVTLAAHLWPGYQVRSHLRVIADRLVRVEAGEVDRLAIDMPPQVGKTMTTVVWGVFWWLARHPAHQVMVVSYGDQLAAARGRAVRRLVVEYGARFGLHIDPASHAAHDWALTSGGGMRSFGIRSGITGNPADAIWVDDPHKSRKEADSATLRQDIHNGYSGDIQSRLAPGAPIILVATRWDADDLTGRLVAEEGRADEGGRWHVVHMPALCTDPQRDPLGRSVGDPLPHPKIPEGDDAALLRHWEDKRSSSTVRDWAALYQGDPQPVEGALLSWEVLRARRCYVHAAVSGPCCADVTHAAVAVDPSGGGRNTAGIVAGYLAADRRLYLTHDRTAVMPSDQWAREACVLAAETDANRVVVERNYGGDLGLLAVRTAWEALVREVTAEGCVWRRAVVGERGESVAGRDGRWVRVPGAVFERLCPRVVAVTARRGKLLRAEPIAQQWVEDRVRTAAPLSELEGEWATWQPDSADSPGRIDASVHLAYELLPVPQSGGSSAAGADLLSAANLLPWGR